MKELKIIIHKGDASNPESKIMIPLTALKIVHTLISKKVKEKMIAEGIDLQEVIKATEPKDASGKLMEIDDKDD